MNWLKIEPRKIAMKEIENLGSHDRVGPRLLGSHDRVGPRLLGRHDSKGPVVVPNKR